MAHEHDGRDEFNAYSSGMENTGRNLPTSTPEDKSTMDAHVRQELAKHDQLTKGEFSSRAMVGEEKLKTPKGVVNDDFSSDLKEKSSFENTMSAHREVELQYEDEVARDEPHLADSKSQILPRKHLENATEHRKDHYVARYECAEPTNQSARASSPFEDKLEAQGTLRSRKQPFEKTPGEFSSDESRHKNGMDNSQDDACIALEKCSDNVSGNGILMSVTQNLDKLPTLKSVADQNEKDRYHQKAALAYASPEELPTLKSITDQKKKDNYHQNAALAHFSPEELGTRHTKDMEALFPAGVQPRTALTQTDEGRPGAYEIVPLGSSMETTRLRFAHESWSRRRDVDEGSQQDIMSHVHAQGHRRDEISVYDEQVGGANEISPVEAHIVENTTEAILAEVVVWYKRPLYRWILIAGVLLVVAIIVLGVRLRAAGSVPTQAPTLVPTLDPTLAPTHSPTTLDAESIACSFLFQSLSECRAKPGIDLRDGSRSNSTIPSELGVLTQLKYLYLDKNGLIGTIPSEMGKLIRLTDLRIHSNQLTGAIPSEMGAMTNLTILNLYWNQLNGTIPSEMGALTGLTYLDLYQNQLTGTIPSELGALIHLASLSLGVNQFKGTIPSEIGAMTNLSTLNMYSNQLSGTIPSELWSLTSLTNLDLYSAQLTGTIPSELGALIHLASLSLGVNQFNGTIPSEVGTMTNLSTLVLRSNKLTGTIPSEIGAMPTLFQMSLSFNQLIGTIPSELGAMISLTHLDLAVNQLTGIIPSELGKMNSLTRLNLDTNDLTGIIPSEIGLLTNLAYWDLHDNQMTGTIPSEMAAMIKVTTLYLFSNLLNGTIPSKLCQLGASTYIDCGEIECDCCYSYDGTTSDTAPCS